MVELQTDKEREEREEEEERKKGRKRERERIFQMTTATRAEPIQSQALPQGSFLWVQGPRNLYHSLLLSEHKKGLDQN